MYQDDFWNQVDSNNNDNNDNKADINNIFDKTKRFDKGYNVVYRKAFKKDGRSYNKKFEIYTSSCSGNHIRDAETGEYFNYIVGSCDEDLFFKVILATGECKSTNGSYTLFYNSPQHYCNHLECKIDERFVSDWEEKKNTRLIEIKRSNNKTFDSV